MKCTCVKEEDELLDVSRHGLNRHLQCKNQQTSKSEKNIHPKKKKLELIKT